MDIQLTLPKRWGDLKQGQLEKIAGIFLKYQDKPDFLTQCFFLFSGWRIVRGMMLPDTDGTYFFFKKKGDKVFCITSELFSQLVSNLQWIIAGFQVPAYVPAIRGFKTPTRLLYEITIGQFLTVENYYSGFVDKGDFKRRPISSRYASFLWFSGVKTWLRSKYPYVFSGSGSDEQIAPDAVILNLLSSLNEGDITRNEKILKTRMHEAFFELNAKIEHSQSNKHV
jgi:hypothetical protein